MPAERVRFTMGSGRGRKGGLGVGEDVYWIGWNKTGKGEGLVTESDPVRFYIPLVVANK